MRRALFLALLLPSVAAAGAVEDALRLTLRDLEMRLAEQQAIAQSLNEYRREYERLKAELEASGADYSGLSTEALYEILKRGVPGGSHRAARNADGTWSIRLSGKGGPDALLRALDGAAVALKGFALRRVEVGPADWSLHAEWKAAAESQTSKAPKARAAPAMPPQSASPSREEHRLRAQIAQARQKLKELERVIGEVQNIDQQRGQAQAALERAKHPDRIGSLHKPLQALLRTKSSPLRAGGVATVTQDGLRLEFRAGGVAPVIEAVKPLGTVVEIDDGSPRVVEVAFAR